MKSKRMNFKNNEREHLKQSITVNVVILRNNPNKVTHVTPENIKIKI